MRVTVAKNVHALVNSGVGLIYHQDQGGNIRSGTCWIFRNFIVTCAHVTDTFPKYGFAFIEFYHSNIDGNNHRVPINMSDLSTKIVHYSPANEFDVVVYNLNLQFTKRHNFELSQTAPITGDKVFALGYPYGQKNLSIHSGYLSSVITSHPSNLLEIDMSINPSNSGGPLVDCDGKVVGIVAMKNTGLSGALDAFVSSAEQNILYLSQLASGGRIIVSGVDPVEQALEVQRRALFIVGELSRSANVGIGYAKPLQIEAFAALSAST